MNKKKKEQKPRPKHKKKIGIFSTMRFDSATSSFLALIVIKAYRKKTEKG